MHTTGHYGDGADFDPGTGVQTLSAYNGDIFVSKLDSNGAYIWARGMGSTLNDYGYDIAVDSTNAVYTIGQFSYTVDFDPGPGVQNLSSNQLSADAFILKLNAAGTYVWARNIGGWSDDNAQCIAVDGSGAIYGGGGLATGGVADFDPGPASYSLGNTLSAGFVLKWSSVELAPEISVTGNGLFIPDGSTTPDPSNHTNIGAGPATRTFTIRNSGIVPLVISGITLSGPHTSDFSVVGAPASVAANGTATFSVDFAPTAAGARIATVSIASNDADESSYDFAVGGTWDVVAGMKDVGGGPLTVVAYPNPFHSDVSLRLGHLISAEAAVGVFDLSGRLMDVAYVATSKGEVKLGSELAPGVYLIEVRVGELSKRIKVVKM